MFLASCTTKSAMQVKYLMQPLHLEFRGLIIRGIMTKIQGISRLTQSIFPLFGLLGSWTTSLETSFGSSTSAARLALRGMSTSTVIHHCPSQIALSMDTYKQVTTVDSDQLVWGEKGAGRPKAIYFSNTRRSWQRTGV